MKKQPNHTIQEEVKELRTLLKQKNRELEIEEALEHIRSRTMAMQNSKELQEVINSIYTRFIELNIKVDSVSFTIFSTHNKAIDLWIGTEGKFYDQQIHIPYIDFGWTKELMTAKESGKSFLNLQFPFEEKNRWWQKAFEVSGFKDIPEERKKYLLEGKSYTGAIAIERNSGIQFNRWNDEAFSEQDQDVQKRFAKVFEQTYTRFLDLQKAEAQAREAQIENALEKVRSRSLAMHKSDELQEVITTVLERLNELGLSMDSAIVGLPSKEQDKWVIWIASNDFKYSQGFGLPFGMSTTGIGKDFETAYCSENVYFTKKYSKKEKDAFYLDLFEKTDFRHIPQERKDFLLGGADYGISVAKSKITMIVAISYTGKILDHQEDKVLQRFSRVFEQAYTRFLDLQKAEAQSREAQIEAALERVRSASLAMHSSDDLHQVINVVSGQFQWLGLHFDSTQFTIINPDRSWDVWISNPNQQYPARINLPFTDHKIFRIIEDARQNKNEFFTVALTKKEKDSLYTHFYQNSVARNTPEERKQYVFNSKSFTLSVAYQKKISLLLAVQNFGDIPYTESENSIIKRFGNVFEQTYTRFLDLQKAEAQAREAQIEAALERIRSRSMAMHKSDELQEVITVVFEQLFKLGIKTDASHICILDDSKDINLWSATADNTYSTLVNLPYFENYIFKDIWESRKKDDILIEHIYNQKEKNQFFTHLFSHTNLKHIPEERKKFILEGRGCNLTTVTFKHTAIFVLKYVDEPYSEEDHKIFIRFGRVFEQTYTRFLDLQKAEVQAREAQVEVALERVRAASMSTHRSAELPNVALTLLNEIEHLGIPLLGAGIALVDAVKETQIFYLAVHNDQDEKKSLLTTDRHPINEIWVSEETLKMVRKGKKEMSFPAEGEKLAQWINWVQKYQSKERANQLREAKLKKLYISVIIFYDYSALAVTSLRPFKEEHWSVVRKLSKTFGMSYTRFLDLQKAEAQAREAQIEAALERVRSRSMAMHKSDELAEVVQVLYQQFEILELTDSSTDIELCIIDEKTGEGKIWQTDKSLTGKNIHLILPFTKILELKEEYQIWISSVPEKRKDLFFTQEYSGDSLKLFLKTINQFDGWKRVVDSFKKNKIRKWVSLNAYFQHGMITYQNVKIKESIIENILPRFAKVFEQTYTRFLDLQKAEEQAREAQIENALEKVRSRSLAMHKSDELQEVITTVLERLNELGLSMDSAIVGLPSKEQDKWVIWIASNDFKYSQGFGLPFGMSTTGIGKDFETAYCSENVYFTKKYSKKEKDAFYLDLFEKTDFRHIPQERKDFLLGGADYGISVAKSKITMIAAISYTGKILDHQEAKVLQRFSRVFEQAYTRFLDLQKAEAQAREAQIEASLERVRAKAMAMHSTKDISDATAIVFNELTRLGVEMVRCGIGILHDTSSQLEIWSTPMSPKDKKVKEVITGYVDSNSHPMIQSIFEAWRNNESYFTYSLHASEVRDYYEKLGKLPGYRFPKSTRYSERQMVHCFYFEQGNIFVYSEDDLSEEQKQLIHRFTKVFSLTYKRYLDLKNAEAQVREAHIEAALERVRSRAMAMHTSSDLPSTASVVFTELRKLGIEAMRSGISIHNKENRKALIYTATKTKEGDELSVVGSALLDNHPVLSQTYESWLLGEDYFPELTGELLKSYYEQISLNFKVPKEQAETKQYGYFISFTHGLFYGWSKTPFVENERQVLKRFASVVDLTFKRYFDLQKAEAQTREAQIEASLERVRGKAMAMHSSEDLASAISIFYHELVGLGSTPIIRCGAGIVDKKSQISDISTVSKSSSRDLVEVRGKIDMNGHPLLKNVYDFWIRKEEYHHILRGNEIKAYYKYLRDQVAIPDYPDDAVQYFYFPMFDEGSFYLVTEKELSEQELQTYRRFTSVLSLTYKRYKDLMDAEARALIAVREASLDRVRAEIASMRTAKDLERITPLVWRELLALGVPFFRCGVMIVVEKEEKIHFYLSTPDGKSLAALHLDFDGIEIARKGLENWRQQKVYTEQWNKEQFIASMKGLMEQGQIQTAETYQGGVEPPESLTLQFVPFPQGMLYVGSEEPLIPSQIELVKALADAFSVAYSRYEDFTKLEEAKAKVEHTLQDLRATQTQLVQAEKMASLGELTAGIAHEIQNPLNFVNNFSEVNSELLEELKAESSKPTAERNDEEILEILNDLENNEEKIKHHGQRASGIVKGMLEHSRTGDGVKEPTDLNALADEYLRLAYHGLRAKDKSFNADFKTDLDPSLPKVNVIPQDIGRVLLNLINNAFYASSSKASATADSSFKSMVEVATKMKGDKIQIIVSDNGSGIPTEIKDKIFQPFFTTKPTGSGTGLGLSLSYDIVKAHGGEITVESNERVGSEFIIQLPI